jgi:signal transduction histidine kinase
VEPLQPPLLRRLRREHWVVLDWAVAVVVAPLASLIVRQGFKPSPDLRGVDVLVIVAAVLAAGSRRLLPPAGLGVVVLVGAAATVITRQPAPWLATAYVMYFVPLRLPRSTAFRILVAALTLAAIGLTGIVPAHHRASGPETLGLAVIGIGAIAMAWTIGYAVGQHRLYAAGVETQHQQRAREQLAQARHAMTEERLRIAREVHDVVAHTMGVIAVQAGVANHVAADQPDEARRALSSIEDTSRGALREMRALLAVLRDEGHPAVDVWPAPQLADLSGLVERAAEAGVEVDLTVSGEPPDLPAGLQLAAYRVVQEAITNVLKHAAADRCRVTVTYGPSTLNLCITDEGQGCSHPSDGHGLAGMRERVGMYGGLLDAEPLPGRGFRVNATFPLRRPDTL